MNITGGTSLTMTQVHEILQHVTDRFGSKEHTVLGAVIDSELGDKLTLTVIGTTDVGTSHKPGKRYAPVPAANAASQAPQPKAKPRQAEPIALDPDAELFETKVEAPELDEHEIDDGPVDPGKQSEFDFPRLEDNRGLFERTEANLYEGEDLDIPTYLRRGIKVAVEVKKG